MNFTDIQIKASYESEVDDLVRDFYVPILSSAVMYDRIAGFFSSSSLAVAAKGITSLISNRGKMRLLTSPRLCTEDAKIIEAAINGEEYFFGGRLLSELNNIQTDFERDHLQALGWMLANNYLEIKLVVGVNEQDKIWVEKLFHQKIGILTDARDNRLSFSGSINESASGWLNNIEEFKVFKEWEAGHNEFFLADLQRFDDFWEGRRNQIKVMDLPQVVKEHLIVHSEGFSIEKITANHYLKTKELDKSNVNLSLFFYQQNALNAWINNGYHLLFEMATGTGKTRTALACVNYAMEQEKQILVIIACPQTTLSKQWRDKEVVPAGFKFDASLIVDGTNRAWKSELNMVIQQLSIGYYKKVIVYTTHETGSHIDFRAAIENLHENVTCCFVGDEAHGLGAPKSKKALLERYKYRIGLSATPKRWFDDYGTQVLIDFFGENSFQFSISDALTTINPVTNKPFLVNYYYNPVFVALSESELEEYEELSNKIKKLYIYSSKTEEYQKIYEKLLFKRASIQKNAEMKYSALYETLLKIGNYENLLFFVSPSQVEPVLSILMNLGIVAHRFTEREGTIPKKEYGGLTERQYLIEKFKKKEYKALVAISCLDEGIDIPTATTAFLMANSTNPREYIQRIGRVIRQSQNKQFSHIYDFIVAPDIDIDLPIELRRFEKQVFNKEIIRAKDMGQVAINNAQVQKWLSNKLKEVEYYDI